MHVRGEDEKHRCHSFSRYKLILDGLTQCGKVAFDLMSSQVNRFLEVFGFCSQIRKGSDFYQVVTEFKRQHL